MKLRILYTEKNRIQISESSTISIIRLILGLVLIVVFKNKYDYLWVNKFIYYGSCRAKKRNN